MNKNNTLLKFRSKEKAERLADMGFKYMIDNSSGKPEYVFALNDNIVKKLVGNFDASDYYFTNKLCFSKTNTTMKGGDGGDA